MFAMNACFGCQMQMQALIILLKKCILETEILSFVSVDLR